MMREVLFEECGLLEEGVDVVLVIIFNYENGGGEED